LESIQSNLKKIYKTDTFGLETVSTNQTHPVSGTTNSSTIIHPTTNLISTSTIMHSPSFQAQTQNHLANREQAIQVLQEIAQYFQTNEPHSPVSYMLQKTIKWSQLPLHEWLSQVIKNENPLENVHELLGVQKNINNSNNDW
jgi:type VI secretion system protein ImpA